MTNRRAAARTSAVMADRSAEVGKPLRASFNTVRSVMDAVRMALLREVIQSVGKRVLIRRGCIISRPDLLRIGDDVFINIHCMLNAEGGISIGADTQIGPYTSIWTSNHRFDDCERPIRTQGDVLAPVSIGRDVWIGAAVIVLAGLTIGDGAIVGAGAVVTSDVAPLSVVAGNPARLIRMRER